MKALIKGGLFLTLGWLTGAAGAQDIQWKASMAKGSTSGSTGTQEQGILAGIRGVSLNQPASPDSGSSIQFRPIVRGQAPDEITIQPLPKLEPGAKDEKIPRPMPKDNGSTPPPPAKIPSPVLEHVGIPMDECCEASICGHRWLRTRFLGDLGCCPDRGGCWATAEYLMWWQRGYSVPILFTGSPIGTSPTQIGVLPGATALYDSVPNPMRSGGRFSVGTWLPHFCNNLGVEVNYFFLGRQSSTANFGPADGLYLGRPFTSVLLQQNNAEVFLASDRTGSGSVTAYSQLWGAEGNFRRKLYCNPHSWIDGILGYRHLNLSEGIDIRENLQITTGNSAGTQFSEYESFRTRNLFNGVQVGLESECRLWGSRCFIGWTSKLALGNVYQIVNIDGSTTRTLPGGAVETQQGALLATSTNIGRYTDNRFAIVPETGVKLGYDITDNLQIYVGYTFIGLSSAVRPGDQIDTNVNSNFRPFSGVANPTGPRVPAVLFRTSEYWAQGVNFGLRYRY